MAYIHKYGIRLRLGTSEIGYGSSCLVTVTDVLWYTSIHAEIARGSLHESCGGQSTLGLDDWGIKESLGHSDWGVATSELCDVHALF